MKRILVALRPGVPGLPLAASHAGFLAEKLGAELILTSCVFDAPVDLALTQADASAARAQAVLLRTERERLESIAVSLRGAGARVSTDVGWRDPVHAGVLEAVERLRADMLVVGAHAQSELGLTETQWELMRLCPCPLLLVRNPEFEGYRLVLAAVDPLHRHAEPTGLDRAVLSAARMLSRAFEARLRVAHAYPDPDRFALASSVQVLPGVFYGTENIAAVHRRAVEELAAAYGLGPSDVELRPGEPAAVLAEIVAELGVELLVLGALKRGRLEQAVLGSTAAIVAADVPCDLLLVKPPPLP